MSERFRHEDIASVPAGWKVRTVTTSGGHRVRVAFPPGRRHKGSGRLVSILHPLTGSNPCGNPCSARSMNPQELIVMGANPPRGRSREAAPMPSNPWYSEKIEQGKNRAVIWAGSEGGPFHAHAYYENEDLGPIGPRSSRWKGYSLQHARKLAQQWLDKQRTRENPRGPWALYKNYQIKRSGKYFKIFTPDGSPLQPRVRDLSGAYALIDSVSEHRPMTPQEHAKVYGTARNPQELLIMGANPYRGRETPRERRKRVTQEWAKALAEGRVVNLPDGNLKSYPTVEAARASGYPIHVWHHSSNPRVEVVHGENPPVEDIHEEFTGQAVKYRDIYNEPHMPAGRYAELGPLIALYVKPAKGGQVLRIGSPENHEDFTEYWNGNPPLIVTDSSSRKIYFVNGCQDISGLLEQFGAQKREGTWQWVLGEVRRIDYECTKEHVADPDENRWKHDHGEEDGQLPTLVFDQSAHRLLYEGGNYRIEGPWIRN